MVTSIRQRETEEQAILRLAQKARDEGVRLLRDDRDGRHYASSVSEPGRWHYITAYSCDCVGFITHGRCMHHSAMLVALGWVTDDHTPEPEPEPIRTATHRCTECGGLGETQCTVSVGRSFRYDWETCRTCHGTGKLATERHAA